MDDNSAESSETPATGPKRGWFQRIFINKNIFYLWTGQIISQSGDSIFEIVLLWLLLDLTGSNAAAGLVAMSAYLPTLLFGLFSGVLVDRFDRRRVMLFADVIRAMIVLIIPLLYVLNGLNGLVLGLLTFFLASFNTLFNPARDVLVGELIQPRDRLTANAMIQTSWQYAFFIGPAAAGVLLSLVGQIHLFNLDALTFLLSFYFIYKIKTRPAPPRPKAGGLRREFGKSWADAVAGLKFAWKDRRIRTLLLITAVDNLFLMGPAIMGAPIFIREILHEGAESYAFIQVAYAIGMVTGTILISRYGWRFRANHIILWGIIFDGITFVPLIWVDSFRGMFVAMCIHALAIPMIIATRPTIIQNIAPPEMQGRIFSMISVAVFGFTAISIAVTGVVSEIIPINIIYAITGVIAAGSGAVGWLIKDFRELD
ncbi:MAG: MFS transporter [Desulfobacterales bacterium]|nr:MFS transporter [Desulfobacterales bacterium]